MAMINEGPQIRYKDVPAGRGMELQCNAFITNDIFPK